MDSQRLSGQAVLFACKIIEIIRISKGKIKEREKCQQQVYV